MKKNNIVKLFLCLSISISVTFPYQLYLLHKNNKEYEDLYQDYLNTKKSQDDDFVFFYEQRKELIAKICVYDRLLHTSAQEVSLPVEADTISSWPSFLGFLKKNPEIDVCEIMWPAK
jgi:hypothetical protein